MLVRKASLVAAPWYRWIRFFLLIARHSICCTDTPTPRLERVLEDYLYCTAYPCTRRVRTFACSEVAVEHQCRFGGTCTCGLFGIYEVRERQDGSLPAR